MIPWHQAWKSTTVDMKRSKKEACGTLQKQPVEGLQVLAIFGRFYGPLTRSPFFSWQGITPMICSVWNQRRAQRFPHQLAKILAPGKGAGFSFFVW